MRTLALSTDFDSCIGHCNNYFVIGHTTPRNDVRGRPFIKNINWWKWSQRASDSLRRSLTSLFEWPRLRPWVGGALLRRCDIRNCRSQDEVPRRPSFSTVRCNFKYVILCHHHTVTERVNHVRLSVRDRAVCVGVGEQACGS